MENKKAAAVQPYIEIIVHKQPMKVLLKACCIASNADEALDALNATYPVPIFSKDDIVTWSTRSKSYMRNEFRKFKNKKPIKHG